MLKTEIDEIERLAKAATKGPWRYTFQTDHYCLWMAEHVKGSQIIGRFADFRFKPDAEYIASVSPDVTLITYVRRLEKVRDAASRFQEITHWGMSESELVLSGKLDKALKEASDSELGVKDDSE
jgi:hypothetical protein